MKWRTKSVGVGLLAVFLFTGDRILKYLFHQLSIDREFFVFGDWVKLKLAYNSGIAFGLPVNQYIIIGFYIVAIVVLAWYLLDCFLKKDLSRSFLTMLIVVGVFSNLLDRLRFGQVIDYIDVKYYSVFNLADVMIVTGILFLVVKNSGIKIKNGSAGV